MTPIPSKKALTSALLGALAQKHYLAWGMVGGAGFLALAGAQAFIKKAEYYTDFQKPFVKEVIALDIFIALVIIGACAWKARAPKKDRSLYSKLLFFLILNGFFLNMLTIPTGVEAWSNFLPFAVLAGILNLLLVAAWIEQKNQKLTF